MKATGGVRSSKAADVSTFRRGRIISNRRNNTKIVEACAVLPTTLEHLTLTSSNTSDCEDSYISDGWLESEEEPETVRWNRAVIEATNRGKVRAVGYVTHVFSFYKYIDTPDTQSQQVQELHISDGEDTSSDDESRRLQREQDKEALRWTEAVCAATERAHQV